ncbi:Hypothetical predicted protein [Cloeon dipterum]|uniref:Secreted protein n=1 Tax=Cloeon dipterum TaxID=197152 RepID=A0A8S1DDP8_9INSE|nr:Hypothetical predicted protein [Cloeon dipterum]
MTSFLQHVVFLKISLLLKGGSTLVCYVFAKQQSALEEGGVACDRRTEAGVPHVHQKRISHRFGSNHDLKSPPHNRLSNNWNVICVIFGPSDSFNL